MNLLGFVIPREMPHLNLLYDCAVQNTYTFYNPVRHIRRFDRLFNILHLPASIPKAQDI
jgi:hypothetical protein